MRKRHGRRESGASGGDRAQAGVGVVVGGAVERQRVRVEAGAGPLRRERGRNIAGRAPGRAPRLVQLQRPLRQRRAAPTLPSSSIAGTVAGHIVVCIVVSSIGSHSISGGGCRDGDGCCYCACLLGGLASSAEASGVCAAVVLRVGGASVWLIYGHLRDSMMHLLLHRQEVDEPGHKI